MKKKKIVLLAGALTVLLAAASYTVFIVPMMEKEEPEYVESQVTKGDLTVGITESGYLEYEIHTIDYDLDLSSILQDDDDEEDDEEEQTVKYLKIEEVYAAQGQMITQGDPLLKFSDDSIQQVRRMLESALADAKVEYNEAESEYRLSVLEAENTMEMQQSAAKYAEDIYYAENSSIDDQITYLQMQITRCQNQITQLQEAVTEAQEDYQEAKTAYEESLEYYNATSVDNFENYQQIKSGYEQAKSTYDRAKSAWEQAINQVKSNSELLTESQEQLTLLTARKNIDKLTAKEEHEETVLSGSNAEYSYKSTLESLKEDLEEAEEEKLLLEEKLADFEALVGTDGILYAPQTGKISEASYAAGDKLERTGNLFSYIVKDGMTVSVDVTQEDIVALRVGDEVNIDFAAYNDENFRGTIHSIDTTATSSDTPTISYTVVINVEGTLEKLYGGMSADILFVTEQREETLYVPRKALVEKNGKTYVWTAKALGGMELQEVTTGIRNESSVEILSGLKEDDKIYVEE